MLLTKEDIIQIQDLLAKWIIESDIPLAYQKIALHHISEELVASGNDIALMLLRRVSLELCPRTKK